MSVHSASKDGPDKSVRLQSTKTYGSNILDQIKVHFLCTAASVYQLNEHYMCVTGFGLKLKNLKNTQ